MLFENSNEDVMYEAVTDSKKSSFLVTLDQIYDIVEKKIGYMVKVTALLIWLLVNQSRSVGEQKRRSTKSEVHYCLMNVCMLVTSLLSKIIVINGHTKLVLFKLIR